MRRQNSNFLTTSLAITPHLVADPAPVKRRQGRCHLDFTTTPSAYLPSLCALSETHGMRRQKWIASKKVTNRSHSSQIQTDQGSKYRYSRKSPFDPIRGTKRKDNLFFFSWESVELFIPYSLKTGLQSVSNFEKRKTWGARRCLHSEAWAAALAVLRTNRTVVSPLVNSDDRLEYSRENTEDTKFRCC